jgi:hypothetical protein
MSEAKCGAVAPRGENPGFRFAHPGYKQQTPEALAAFHKAEVEKWWPIIKAANLKGE